jgi:hypothetical protein
LTTEWVIASGDVQVRLCLRAWSTTSHEAPVRKLTQINSTPKALWSIMFDGAGTVKRHAS